MKELRLVAFRAPSFPGSFEVKLKDDGRLLGVGRDALRAAAERALEEGIATGATMIKMTFADGNATVIRTVDQVLAGNEFKAAA